MHFKPIITLLLWPGAFWTCVVASNSYELDRSPLLDETSPEDSEADGARLASFVNHAFVSPLPFVEASVNDFSSETPPPPPTATLHIDSSDAPHSSQMSLFGKARYTALPQPAFSSPKPGANPQNTIKEQTPLRRRHKDSKYPNPMAVTFAVLGAIVGCIALILCGRSIHHYFRTPRRDLVADHIDRYNLERELAESEEARLGMLSIRETSFAQHPPPYQEAPKYEDVTNHTRVTTIHPQSSQAH